MFGHKDFGEFAKGFEKLVDDVMSRSIGDLVGSDFVQSTPAANVKEGDDSYIIELAAPGLSKTDFEIKLEGDQLKVRVNPAEEENSAKGQFTRREFNYKSFYRNFTIPADADRSKIGAAYKNGILIITMMKYDSSSDDKSQTIHVL